MAACFSLPTPPGTDSVAIPGLRAGGVPIAWWNPQMLERLGWDAKAGDPRRLLMAVASDEEIPEGLTFRAESPMKEQAWAGPEASARATDSFKRGSFTRLMEVGGELSRETSDRWFLFGDGNNDTVDDPIFTMVGGDAVRIDVLAAIVMERQKVAMRSRVTTSVVMFNE